jgi:hypothetical protein
VGGVNTIVARNKEIVDSIVFNINKIYNKKCGVVWVDEGMMHT